MLKSKKNQIKNALLKKQIFIHFIFSSFEVEGRPTTMVEFFRTKKNVNIDPNMPAVRQHVDRESCYPLKCLHVLPFQRLSLDKMSLNEQMANISKNLLTVCLFI